MALSYRAYIHHYLSINYRRMQLCSVNVFTHVLIIYTSKRGLQERSDLETIASFQLFQEAFLAKMRSEVAELEKQLQWSANPSKSLSSRADCADCADCFYQAPGCTAGPNIGTGLTNMTWKDSICQDRSLSVESLQDQNRTHQCLVQAPCQPTGYPASAGTCTAQVLWPKKRACLRAMLIKLLSQPVAKHCKGNCILKVLEGSGLETLEKDGKGEFPRLSLQL